MSGLMRHIERWLADHTSLPPTIVPSAAVTDDDVEHWSDLRYMADLFDDLMHRCHRTHGSARRAASMLARPTIDDQEVDALDSPWHVDAAGDALKAWRIRLVAQRNSLNWWLGEQRHSADAARAVA